MAAHDQLNTRHWPSIKLVLAPLCLITMAGCSFSPPPLQADQADLAACTAQADETYQAQNYESLSRTSQNGVRFSATPNHVFDAEQLGAMHQRDSSITDCVDNGGTTKPVIPGPPLVASHIVGPQP